MITLYLLIVFDNEIIISHLTSLHNCRTFFLHGSLSLSCVRAVPFRDYRVCARLLQTK